MNFLSRNSIAKQQISNYLSPTQSPRPFPLGGGDRVANDKSYEVNHSELQHPRLRRVLDQ